MGNFHPDYRDLRGKNRDLGNRASPASHMNTSIFSQRMARRDLGNRASPVDRAHMKSPLGSSYMVSGTRGNPPHELPWAS